MECSKKFIFAPNMTLRWPSASSCTSPSCRTYRSSKVQQGHGTWKWRVSPSYPGIVWPHESATRTPDINRSTICKPLWGTRITIGYSPLNFWRGLPSPPSKLSRGLFKLLFMDLSTKTTQQLKLILPLIDVFCGVLQNKLEYNIENTDDFVSSHGIFIRVHPIGCITPL